MQQRILLSISSVALFAVCVFAEDWPQWRGANRDAVSNENSLMAELPDGKLPRRWTAPIGAGYSGPTVANGRVYVTDRGPQDVETEVERVLCFNESDGELIWEHTYEAKYTISYRAGPRASVTIHDGWAISVGAMGNMICLDAETGEVRWERDLLNDYKIRMPIWGIAGAPLVYENLVIQIVAGEGDSCVVAFDLETGKEQWRAIDETAAYSAPILIQQGGQDIVVCWTGESITGLDPQSGKVYWSEPMLPRNMPIGCPTPVASDSHLFVASFYDGSMLLEIDSTQPAAKKLWHRIGTDEKNTDGLHSMIGTPIIKGDHIYGVDSYGELRCLELKTGDRVWEDQTAVPRARWATIHIIQNGDREIMFNERGDLIFATLSPDGYEEHSRANLIAPTRQQLNRRDGVTWAHPAIANGHIFIRSDEELVCASLLAD